MCPVCQAREAAAGVLCSACRDQIAPPVRATPEQIQLLGEASTDAVVVDVWGRPHRLSPSTLIGRHVGGQGLAVFEASVSRHHARFEREEGAWWLYDLASANGTFVDGQQIQGAVPLRDGARVRFGQMSFYFLPNGVRFWPARIEAQTGQLPILAYGSGQIEVASEPEPEPEPLEGSPDAELPSISLKLHEPIGGGGGFMELDGKRVQLTATQLELIALMARRMTADATSPPFLRGFVRSAELIATLSWDTSEPNENHVKQLIRRVRRALTKVEHGDLIESRHRFGYRLRAIPRGD
jgi:hypothetical protein